MRLDFMKATSKDLVFKLRCHHHIYEGQYYLHHAPIATLSTYEKHSCSIASDIFKLIFS